MSDNTCPICLDTKANWQGSIRAKCGHEICLPCFMKHTKKNQNASCPMCRAAYIEPSQEEEEQEEDYYICGCEGECFCENTGCDCEGECFCENQDCDCEGDCTCGYEYEGDYYNNSEQYNSHYVTNNSMNYY